MGLTSSTSRSSRWRCFRSKSIHFFPYANESKKKETKANKKYVKKQNNNFKNVYLQFLKLREVEVELGKSQLKLTKPTQFYLKYVTNTNLLPFSSWMRRVKELHDNPDANAVFKQKGRSVTLR